MVEVRLPNNNRTSSVRQSHSHVRCDFRSLNSMDPKKIVDALRARNIPHKDIAEAIGRERSVATKLVTGKRDMQVTEIEPLLNLLKEHDRQFRHTGNTSDKPDIIDVRSDLPAFVEVPEYDVRLSAGGGFIVDEETTRRRWPMSRWLLQDYLNVPLDRVTMQEVIGDSMSPTLESGDFVLIDLTDKRLGLPGVFAVWDGDALVCKRLERVPGTDPAQVKLKSDNPLHSEYIVPADRVNIVGRVRWFTRRM